MLTGGVRVQTCLSSSGFGMGKRGRMPLWEGREDDVPPPPPSRRPSYLRREEYNSQVIHIYRREQEGGAGITRKCGTKAKGDRYPRPPLLRRTLAVNALRAQSLFLVCPKCLSLARSPG